jgi:hypothetical protein
MWGEKMSFHSITLYCWLFCVEEFHCMWGGGPGYINEVGGGCRNSVYWQFSGMIHEPEINEGSVLFKDNKW